MWHGDAGIAARGAAVFAGCGFGCFSIDALQQRHAPLRPISGRAGESVGRERDRVDRTGWHRTDLPGDELRGATRTSASVAIEIRDPYDIVR